MSWFGDFLDNLGDWITPWDTAREKRERHGTPPDPSAWMYQGLGQYPGQWVKQGEKAIRQQTTNWLENALRGIRGEMSGRGWTPSTSGQYGELGERASGIASQNMSTALAQLYAQAAGIQHQGSLAGANLFQQAYMNYLYPPNQTGDGGDDWINSVLAILPTLL